MFGIEFFIRSVFLGVGLAMDAAAVSMANGFNEPQMPIRKAALIAFFFGLFQALMPLIGYFVGYSLLKIIQKLIPWIALVLLGFLGVKMIIDGAKDKQESGGGVLTLSVLMAQAFATSVDALSVGFTMADYSIAEALICVLIVAVVTFFISFGSVFIGKKFGTALGGKAEIAGGIILILIGLEIFITGMI